MAGEEPEAGAAAGALPALSARGHEYAPAAAAAARDLKAAAAEPVRHEQAAAAAPPGDADGSHMQPPCAEALAAQFQAQLAALTALSLGQVPPESVVLAACGGRVPAAAAAELAQAAAAHRSNHHTAAGSQAAGAADQQTAAGPDAAEGSQDASDAEALRAAIRAKMRRLAPVQHKVQEDVLRERELYAQVSEFKLLDWKRMRRPLPGSNPRAFEPPLQPIAMLLQQQQLRAQRTAALAKTERALLQRQHERRQQAAAQAGQQQQPEQQQQQQRQQQEEQEQEERRQAAARQRSPGAGQYQLGGELASLGQEQALMQGPSSRGRTPQQDGQAMEVDERPGAAPAAADGRHARPGKHRSQRGGTSPLPEQP